MKRIPTILFALLALGCGQRQAQPSAEAVAEAARGVFLPALAPSALPPAEKRAYLREHYWDRFDFADTTFVRMADSMRMIEAFGRYAMLLADNPTDGEPVRRLMARAARSRTMTDYFAWMAEAVWHDPNSPLRNDEMYIPVLEALLASPFYDRYERLGPEHELKMARQNRIGRRANDIRYRLASGRRGSLYGLKADFVLVFINNPDCAMCRTIREQIVASPGLEALIRAGRLKVLAIYPDEDLAAWRAYRDRIPATWINAYDEGCTMRETGSYNLHAIPALYLLDGAKRVLVKDSTDVGAIERAIAEAGEATTDAAL